MLSLPSRPNFSSTILVRIVVIATAFLTTIFIWNAITASHHENYTPLSEEEEEAWRSHEDFPSESSLWSQVSKYLPLTKTSPAPPLHNTDNIMLIMKTGATVIDARLPVHLNTTLPPAKHLLVFSSMNQTFGEYPVYDILTNVSETWKKTSEDFTVYRELQKLAGSEEEENVRERIAEMASGKAWDLDKWKFMPMVFEALYRAPREVEWFVMVEADTSFSWTNLGWWLSGFDSRKP